MPTWPSSLPQKVQVEQFSHEIGTGAVRTEMEAGPDFQRRRSTAAPESFRGRIWLTAAEYETFRTFWRDELGDGALAFDWQHPVTLNAARVQFDVTSPPRVSAVSGEQFALTMQFEVLP